MTEKLGLYITGTGNEGSGKSTQMKILASHLAKEFGADNVLLVKEPGFTDVGAKLRKILLSGTHIPARAEVFLFSTDRAILIDEFIKPALIKKKIVCADRSFYDTLAYQVFGRGLAYQEVKKLCDYAIDGCKPDLALWFDLPVEVGLARKKNQGGKEWSKFEDEKLAFHDRVRAGFGELAKKEREIFIRINADQSKKETTKEMLQKFNEWRVKKGI